MKHCKTLWYIMKYCKTQWTTSKISWTTRKTSWNTLKTLWNVMKHSNTCHSMWWYRLSMPRHWHSAIVEETPTSEEYISGFLISILNIYIWNLNIYVAIRVIFKEKCTNCQPVKIMQVKRTNAFFLLLFFKWKHWLL